MLGQSSSTLTLTYVSDERTQAASVIVSNLAGRVISSPARLTVIPLPRLIATRSGLDLVLTWAKWCCGFQPAIRYQPYLSYGLGDSFAWAGPHERAKHQSLT